MASRLPWALIAVISSKRRSSAQALALRFADRAGLRRGPVEQGGRSAGAGGAAHGRQVAAPVRRGALRRVGRRPHGRPARVGDQPSRSRTWWWPRWNRPRPTPHTGRANRWPSAAGYPSPRSVESGRPSSCSPIAARTSSCPMIRCSWRRSMTSSGSTSTRPRPRWCCAWTRSPRYRRWHAASRRSQ